VLRRYVVFAVGLIMLIGPLARADDTAPRQETIVIETDKTSHMLAVEIADTPALRERGLMFRHRLPDDRGMLFLYGRAEPVAMWMKNTYSPLDMVFVRGDGSIAEVVEGAVPHSLETIRSREPVLAVLEVAAGNARKLGLKPGTVIRHSFFGNAD
jgi:uncharacterized membrane protein (UPF0127 family)